MPYLNQNELMQYPGQLQGPMSMPYAQPNPFALMPMGVGMGSSTYSGQGSQDMFGPVTSAIDATNALLKTNNEQNLQIIDAINKIIETAIKPEMIQAVGDAIVSAISQASGKAISTPPAQSRSMPNIGLSMDRNVY
jgi:hypothetical protein